MRRLFSLLILLSTVLLAACQQAPPKLTDADRAAIERAITDRLDDFVKAGEELDLDFVRLFDEEAVLGRSGSLFKSPDEMLAVFRSGFEGLSKQEIGLTYSKVTVLAPNVAIVSSEGVFTVTDTTGATTPEYPFVWTFAFVERDGDWRAVQAHVSFGAAN